GRCVLRQCGMPGLPRRRGSGTRARLRVPPRFPPPRPRAALVEGFRWETARSGANGSQDPLLLGHGARGRGGAGCPRTSPAAFPRGSGRRLMEPFRRLLPSAASGALFALAFPKASLWPLALIGLIPLLLAMDRAETTAPVLDGLVWGAGFFGVLLS